MNKPETTKAHALLLASTLLAAPAAAQGHSHDHSDHHHHHGTRQTATEGRVLSIDEVLRLPQNTVLRRAHGGELPQDKAPTSRPKATGRSGQGSMAFAVHASSKHLPKKVFETNPFDGKRKRSVLACAHGGFAYDHRSGQGEVYWFLQGGGMLRVRKDRTKIDLLPTDEKMLKWNLHNATFFEHKGKGHIAWPANSGGRVFITDTEGKLLHTVPRPTIGVYAKGARYAPTDTAYLDGKLWVTDGYASKYVMAYDLDAQKWTDTIFGGPSRKAEPGKFGTNHGITIHKGMIYIAGRYFARIHSYKPDTKFVSMFPLPEGSKPCDFEFFVQGDKLYGVAASLNKAKGSPDKGAAIYIVDMKTLKIVSTIKPKDELGLSKFTHLHNVFATVDDGKVTLFCQAWNGGDFAVLRQQAATKKPKQESGPGHDHDKDGKGDHKKG